MNQLTSLEFVAKLRSPWSCHSGQRNTSQRSAENWSSRLKNDDVEAAKVALATLPFHEIDMTNVLSHVTFDYAATKLSELIIHMIMDVQE